MLRLSAGDQRMVVRLLIDCVRVDPVYRRQVDKLFLDANLLPIAQGRQVSAPFLLILELAHLARRLGLEGLRAPALLLLECVSTQQPDRIESPGSNSQLARSRRAARNREDKIRDRVS